MSAGSGPRLAWIERADDPRLAGYRDLRHRTPGDTFVAEGRLLVRRLLAASRFRVRSVLATPAALTGLLDALSGAGAPLPVHVAPAAVIDRTIGFAFHRGCLALGERCPTAALEPLVAPAGRRILVVLDDVTDPDNVGAIFRNAAAFGAAGVLLSPGSGDPLYRKALRVSMGGALAVPFARAADWSAALARLRAAGFTRVALTPGGGQDLAALAVPGRVALVLGAEGRGLGPAARAAGDVEATIPMAAGADSLNVATAAGIALYLLARAAAAVS
jgi:tRNA G18 (ribose-2'-O)-methylase SpoU